MPWKYNNQMIREHRAWKDDAGTQHPKNWQIWTDAEKQAAGLVWEEPPAAEAPEPRATSADIVRVQRDNLIAESDWRVIKALELGETVPTDWATYRQALRDVPAQEGFPTDVTWPVAPDYVEPVDPEEA